MRAELTLAAPEARQVSASDSISLAINAASRTQCLSSLRPAGRSCAVIASAPIEQRSGTDGSSGAVISAVLCVPRRYLRLRLFQRRGRGRTQRNSKYDITNALK